jgi:hypothetical protein
MRQGTSHVAWLVAENGDLQGISCGSDPCSEHEGGIGELREALGIKSHYENGLADRVAKQQPPFLVMRQFQHDDGQPHAWLALGNYRYLKAFSFGEGQMPPEQPPFFNEVRSDYGNPTLSAAWDSSGVLIYARGTESVRRLEQFHEWVKQQDLALGNAFTGRRSDWHSNASGLVFVKASAIPQALADQALAEDQKNVRLRKAAAKLGIEQELKAAGLRWFALSPRWADDQETEVKFWLNPMEQQDYNYGLFSVDELRQWAKGTGPVMIDKPLRAQAKSHEKAIEALKGNIRRAKFEVPSMWVVWANPEKSEVAINVHYYHPQIAKRPLVDQGEFSLAELQERFPNPVKAPRKKPGMR